MKLSNRLNEIVKFCGKPLRVADVGCDHGKVILQLLKNGAKFAVATDISMPSVKKAEKLLQENGFSNFSIRVGNGCETLTEQDNLSLIVIAGMGGQEIISILENSPIKLNNLVLQPQKDVQKLRIYLQNNKFYIIKDKVIKDGKIFYNILKVKKVDKLVKLTQKQIKYGKTNLKTTNLSFVQMLEFENNVLEQRLLKLKNMSLINEVKSIIMQNNNEIIKAKSRR